MEDAGYAGVVTTRMNAPETKTHKGERANVEETKVERETVEEEGPKEVKAMNQEEERDTEKAKGDKGGGKGGPKGGCWICGGNH